MSAIPEVTFGLVHGSWHGAWCWDYLKTELDELGYRSVAMDLPIEDPNAQFDTYASTVVEALDGESDLVLVGHSRGANVIPRAAGQLATRKLIYLCGSFEPSTIGRPTKREKRRKMPPRNSEEFIDGMNSLDQNLTTLGRDLAVDLLYHDCPPEKQDWAVDNLLPQRRFDGPEFGVMPKIPKEYILCKDDRVVSPAWSRYIAKNWLKIEPVEMPGGHSPFLSRPRELAQLLVKLSF